MYGYIYLTTNLINGKKYIGKHHSSYFTENYKGSGKILKQAFTKYGWDNFKVELIEECLTKDELNSKERYWTAKCNAVLDSKYYNLATGGEGVGLPGDLNPTKRPEVRAKMSRNHADFSGKNNPNYGGLSEKNKENLRLSHKLHGYQVGEKNNMYGRRGELSPHFGKIHVNNGVKFIAIKESEFEEYKLKGFTKTRNKSISGKVYINNGQFSILISHEDLNTYLEKGWIRGKKKFPINRNFRRSSTIESIGSEKSTTE